MKKQLTKNTPEKTQKNRNFFKKKEKTEDGFLMRKGFDSQNFNGEKF